MRGFVAGASGRTGVRLVPLLVSVTDVIPSLWHLALAPMPRRLAQ